MKCVLCTTVCAILVIAGSLLPVSAGEFDAPNREVQTVREFNTLLNLGELERAEALANDSFLKNSSDPLAVLMLRQVLLTRKAQAPSVVFPLSIQKSRVLTPPPHASLDELCTQTTGSAISPNREIRPYISTQRTGSLQTSKPLSLTIDFSSNNLLLQSAQKSCNGGCLEPINAPKSLIEQSLAHSVNSQEATAKNQIDPKERPDWTQQYSVGILNPHISFAPADSVNQPKRSSSFANAESTITLHLIKGSVDELDRMGIAIQSEPAQQISQPRLNAAKAALPTPITVPVLAPSADGKREQVGSPLAPFTTQQLSVSEAELSITVCSQRDKVIRHVGEPLATRRLSSEERQEILKAAQAASRINITSLPRLLMLNDQSAELSSSVVDSTGKTMKLGIQTSFTPDHRAVSLNLAFHSDQGPAALTQAITVSDLLENEEALLIALDAPRNVTETITSATNDQQTTYLVVSPTIRKLESPKIAVAGSTPSAPSRGRRLASSAMWGTISAQRVSAERSIAKDNNPRLETRVYSVADLVIPIPKSIDLNVGAKAAPVVPKQIPAQVDFDSLIKTIKSTIQPEAWSEAGGVGTIRPFETTLSLVVRQTEPVHREIQQLISKLRRELDVQVSVEFRLVSGDSAALADAGYVVTPQDVLLSQAELKSRNSTDKCSDCATACPTVHTDCSDVCHISGTLDFLVSKTKSLHPCLALLEQIGFEDFATECCTERDCCESEKDSSATTLAVKLLTSSQHAFLSQSVQSHKNCNTLFAPKITHFNNQSANVNFGDEVTFKMQTTVDASRSAMFVNLSAGNETRCSPLRSFSGKLLPGESLLVALPTGSSTQKSPSKLETRFVLITPRIIVVEEETEQSAKPVY